jgi:hypothetical protein
MSLENTPAIFWKEFREKRKSMQGKRKKDEVKMQECPGSGLYML